MNLLISTIVLVAISLLLIFLFFLIRRPNWDKKYSAAVSYYESGAYVRGLSNAKAALKILQKQDNPNRKDLGATLSLAGLLYHQLGLHADAKKYLTQAVEISANTFCSDNEEINRGLQEVAEKYELKLNENFKTKIQPSDPLDLLFQDIEEGPDQEQEIDVLGNLKNAAELHFAQGQFIMAKSLYERLLHFLGEDRETDDPEMVEINYKLAVINHDQGLFEQAEKLYKSTLAAWEKIDGEESERIGTLINNLASLYQAHGKYQKAAVTCRRGLVIRNNTLTPGHLDVAESLINLAGIYCAQEEYEQAEPFCRQALNIREKAQGLIHPDVAQTLEKLADIYRRQEKYALIEMLYKRALIAREEILGKDHPETACMEGNLGIIYQEQGDFEKAEEHLKKSLEAESVQSSSDRVSVANRLNQLGGLYLEQGLVIKAEPLLKLSFEMMKEAVGDEHPELIPILGNMSKMLKAKGLYIDAKDLDTRKLLLLQKQ